ncbi:hypothetical protein Aglo03_48650 [Actinokineospora globicatena]|uniref:Bacteriophage T5 Orf172 DNA-binding domain-containing protein n=1 Tax=Actinokineospora globicatena TaxID=103729 RepID=A0A9W6QSV9_9PSEU|nr:hypothetical protein Aglo03_48650 [Actinokineospora globicatena]
MYVLTSLAMPDMVKVGHTRHLSEDRARQLRTTAVPLPFTVAYRTLTSHPAAVERRAHELLAFHRVDPRREYFTVTPAQAVAAIQRASIEAGGIEAWDTEEPVMLRDGDRVALTLRAGQWLVVLPYQQGPVRLGPVDLWQAHSDGDLLELMATDSAGRVAGLSTDDEDGTIDPVPHLDRAGDVSNLPIIGRERLEPGQRLLWLDGAIEPPACSMAMFEFDSHCQVACRTASPLLSPEGFPLLLNIVTEEPTETMVQVIRAALRLRPPVLTLQPAGSSSGPDDIGGQSSSPSFWLPQLGKQVGKSRHPRNS